MIDKLHKKLWVNGQFDFVSALILILVPAVPAFILGSVLFGLSGQPNFISNTINDHLLISWIGFFLLTAQSLYTLYCLDKASDKPIKMNSDEERE